ncbi:MAG: c-type cytochrome [SAR324 cluster bacterium]|nr:c-type cytochrome [SAR324 cluster bacterium]
MKNCLKLLISVNLCLGVFMFPALAQEPSVMPSDSLDNELLILKQQIVELQQMAQSQKVNQSNIAEIEELKQEIQSLKEDLTQIQNKQNSQSVMSSSSDAQLILGRQIYLSACKSCHGINGDGKGHGGKRLDPAPRDFTKGEFRWRSTLHGTMPTDEDLDRTIRDGVSGSEMVPFGNIISKQKRMAVIQYIKSFSHKFNDPELKPEGTNLVTIPKTRPSSGRGKNPGLGKILYNEKGCYLCHGETGEGDGIAAYYMETKPWDFTKGYYKSGSTPRDLYRSITTGLNGTFMPTFIDQTTEEERWHLVDYVLSLGDNRKGFNYTVFQEEPTGKVYDQYYK